MLTVNIPMENNNHQYKTAVLWTEGVSGWVTLPVISLDDKMSVYKDVVQKRRIVAKHKNKMWKVIKHDQLLTKTQYWDWEVKLKMINVL